MTWQIDLAHSHIQFSIRHMMVSTVRGQFERFGGTIELDEQTPSRSTVDVQIEAASPYALSFASSTTSSSASKGVIAQTGPKTSSC